MNGYNMFFERTKTKCDGTTTPVAKQCKAPEAVGRTTGCSVTDTFDIEVIDLGSIRPSRVSQLFQLARKEAHSELDRYAQVIAAANAATELVRAELCMVDPACKVKPARDAT